MSKTKMNSDQKRLAAIEKKDRRRNRAVRKKVWTSNTVYCEDCFYEVLENEEHVCPKVVAQSFLYIEKEGRYRKQHPQMLKILKERKESASGAVLQ